MGSGVGRPLQRVNFAKGASLQVKVALAEVRLVSAVEVFRAAKNKSEES